VPASASSSPSAKRASPISAQCVFAKPRVMRGFVLFSVRVLKSGGRLESVPATASKAASPTATSRQRSATASSYQLRENARRHRRNRSAGLRARSTPPTEKTFQSSSWLDQTLRHFCGLGSMRSAPFKPSPLNASLRHLSSESELTPPSLGDANSESELRGRSMVHASSDSELTLPTCQSADSQSEFRCPTSRPVTPESGALHQSLLPFYWPLSGDHAI
jgi:hypothetical protein